MFYTFDLSTSFTREPAFLFVVLYAAVPVDLVAGVVASASIVQRTASMPRSFVS
jgi:hypothetical protein